jgi:hypothetical protein
VLWPGRSNQSKTSHGGATEGIVQTCRSRVQCTFVEQHEKDILYHYHEKRVLALLSLVVWNFDSISFVGEQTEVVAFRGLIRYEWQADWTTAQILELQVDQVSA